MATLPDYCVRPSAVLEDSKINWRHGKVPDYSAAEENYSKGKTVTHEPGSLGDIVSNLVKNWEKEMSYKTDAADFRTIDPDNFSFSVNGGAEMSAEKVLELGTYNALIGDQDLYCSSKTNFVESHEAFRNAMPGGFAWEVLEVYSGPPKVVFKWRHWGSFTGPLVCPMASGEKKAFPPTGKQVELFGMAVAHVDDKMRVTRIEIWNDPNEPMRSMAGAGAA